jgi:glyoxylase-like metal-dependent hydrolase (beta-lactamase superfamily II)
MRAEEPAMPARLALALLSAAAVATAAWFAAGDTKPAGPPSWEQLEPGVFRTKASPHSYALVLGDKALLIDAAASPEAVAELGAKSVEVVLLTHHHRDTAAFASDYRKKGVAVRAPKASADWLTPEGVAKFWKDSIPLRNSRTAYFVLPVGVDGVDCSLGEKTPITFGNWTLTPVATPGHSRDHLAYLCEPGDPKLASFLFCGDAFCSPGKIWTPYTTDWDHWTDAGLKPTAESLRKMAKLKFSHLCPAHGPVLSKDIAPSLEATAKLVDEAGFQKSFERFSKDRLGNPPKYEFLVPKEQIASGGDKPWSKVSDHVWITGNTYVVKSSTGTGIFVLDPWGQRSADQVAKLQKDEKLGAVELVAFSHAHYDHFDGVHVLKTGEPREVWSLDLVALPLKEPFRLRAPFLDERPIAFTKELKDGESATWGGYTFKFHHLPGQSWFTSGIEATIDGKRCVFTADNFFHQDQFSGTGGWMGLNRSSPAAYGSSAAKVLDIAPEWILAEHGGPYVFSKEDYARRVKWGEAAGKACDAVCVSGDHLRDWTPHRVSVEPALTRAKPGDEITLQVTLSEAGRDDPGATVVLQGRGLFPDQSVTFPAGAKQTKSVKVRLPADLAPGLHVFTARTADRTGTDFADPYFAVDAGGK